jgi:hypothetical protein
MSPGLQTLNETLSARLKKKGRIFTEVVVRLEEFTDFEVYLVKH